LAKPVKEKYPYITLERYVKKLPDAIAASEEVDMYIEWHGPMGEYMDLGFFEDITPLAKQYNLDLSKVDNDALEAVRVLSPNKKELYGIPYTDQVNAIYYNKSIFDKFGVPYPKDGMTWDETLELSKRLTREEGGVKYYGLGTENYTRIVFPLSPKFIDPATNRSRMNSDPVFAKGFGMFQKIFAAQNKTKLFADDEFIKDKTVAMYATRNILFAMAESDLDWDVAQFPSYPELPNISPMHDLHTIMPSKNSKHQEELARVLEIALSDKFHQYLVTTVARVSTLKDKKYQEELGKGNPGLQGKHLPSIFKSKQAPGVDFTKYYQTSIDALRPYYKDMLENKIDLNTFLRSSAEATDKAILAKEGK
jgi:multiple sugar transport system substrate-binding protein